MNSRQLMSIASRRGSGRFFGVRVGVSAVIAACVAMATPSAGAAPDVGAIPAKKPTLIYAGSWFACSSFSPLSFDTASVFVAYESLIKDVSRPSGRLALRPGLATSWKVTNGNKVMTLTLRRNARFSDGTPVTARAIKTWIEYFDKQPVRAADAMPPIRSVDALGKWVVRITLKTPNPIFAESLTQVEGFFGRVVNPKAIAALTADPKNDVFARQTWGSGQYVVVPSQTVIGDHCTYVPNKHYYNQSQIKWGKIVVRKIADLNALLAALQTGQVDVAPLIGGPQTPPVTGINRVPYRLGEETVQFNIGDPSVPALRDVRVRRALNYAIDRQAIAKAVLNEFAKPTSLPNPLYDSPGTKYANYYSYDPAKAKSLLAAAGYAKGFSFKLNTFGPWVGPGRTDRWAEAVAKYLAAVGVDVEVLSTATPSEYVAARESRKYAALALGMGALPSWRWYQFLLHPGSALGDQFGWYDPESTRLFLKAQRLPPKAAAEFWRQMQRRAVTQAFFLPVAELTGVHYVSRRVGGMTGVSNFHDPTTLYPTTP